MMRFFRWLLSLFHKAPKLTHGVYVFCGWASPRPEFGLVPGVQCPTATPWALQTQDRVPLLGEYDERLPLITQKRCEWMVQGKIDYAVYQLDWRHDTHEWLMSHCAENHPTDSPIRFCISFFDVLANTTDRTYYNNLTPAQLEVSWKKFADAIRPFTTRPNYLHQDGRPVLFLGYAGNTSARFIDIIKQVIPNVYLVATAVEPNAKMQLKVKGFDAFTEYLLYSAEGWAGVIDAYRNAWDQGIAIAKQTGISYWVPACAGFDGRAQAIPQPSFMPTPSEFTAHLVEARTFARDNAAYTRGQVITYAWSEFGEGGILEPMAAGMLHSGDEMLVAHAKAVA